jgi:hypothetical protein
VNLTIHLYLVLPLSFHGVEFAKVIFPTLFLELDNEDPVNAVLYIGMSYISNTKLGTLMIIECVVLLKDILRQW